MWILMYLLNCTVVVMLGDGHCCVEGNWCQHYCTSGLNLQAVNVSLVITVIPLLLFLFVFLYATLLHLCRLRQSKVASAYNRTHFNSFEANYKSQQQLPLCRELNGAFAYYFNSNFVVAKGRHNSHPLWLEWGMLTCSNFSWCLA